MLQIEPFFAVNDDKEVVHVMGITRLEEIEDVLAFVVIGRLPNGLLFPYLETAVREASEEEIAAHIWEVDIA